jgi:hypothetical protein
MRSKSDSELACVDLRKAEPSAFWEILVAFDFLNRIGVGPTGWSIAPGTSVSATVPLGAKFIVSLTGEGGDFTATNEKHANDKYAFDYAIGGVGWGISPPMLPDAQIFPASWPSGSIGTVWRIPPYSPPGGKNELGAPTGFEGGAMVIAGGAAGGLMPAYAGSIGYMFMGHVGAPTSIMQAVKRAAVSTAIGVMPGIGPLYNVIKDFKYVALVWCTGLSTPTASAGITGKVGYIKFRKR